MSKRMRAAIQVAALSIICGLIIWHVVQWHYAGMYLHMFNWIGTNKAYITVIYNLGLMVLLGVVLGLLLEKITYLLGYEVTEVKHFDGETKVGKRQ